MNKTFAHETPGLMGNNKFMEEQNRAATSMSVANKDDSSEVAPKSSNQSEDKSVMIV